MKKILLISFILICLELNACYNNDMAILSETSKEIEIEEVIESSANAEYDSIEAFRKLNNASIFTLEPLQISKEINSVSEDILFSATDKNVSVSESYVAVTYDCKFKDNSFWVKLFTYTLPNGKRQLESVINNNSAIFTEEEVEGISVYYSPGTEYDWFDCYATVLDDKMLVINIDKEYVVYIGEVVKNTMLQ